MLTLTSCPDAATERRAAVEAAECAVIALASKWRGTHGGSLSARLDATYELERAVERLERVKKGVE